MAILVQAQQEGVETIPEMIAASIQSIIQTFVLALPELIAAAAVLFVGWIVGMILGGSVRALVDRIELDRYVKDTPLGTAMGGTDRGVSKTLGKITSWFVYAIAFLAAASLLDIAILSEWIARVITYLPSFIAGLLVILGGFILADFIGDIIARTRTATGTPYTQWFADGARIFLYFIFVTIGLDTMGIDVTLLYIFARAFAWGSAIGLALAIGIGFGWGMKDYISNNIDKWTRKAREKT